MATAYNAAMRRRLFNAATIASAVLLALSLAVWAGRCVCYWQVTSPLVSVYVWKIARRIWARMRSLSFRACCLAAEARGTQNTCLSIQNR